MNSEFENVHKKVLICQPFLNLAIFSKYTKLDCNLKYIPTDACIIGNKRFESGVIKIEISRKRAEAGMSAMICGQMLLIDVENVFFNYCNN